MDNNSLSSETVKAIEKYLIAIIFSYDFPEMNMLRTSKGKDLFLEKTG